MEGGYEESRFTTKINGDLMCAICCCVLKDPRTCSTGEHYFCYSCIYRSLSCSERCPVCRDCLTLDTLNDPGPFLKKVLSELMIKCCYVNEGCNEILPLGDLEIHKDSCSYRQNTSDNSHVEMNAENEENCEKSSCQFDDEEVSSVSSEGSRTEDDNRRLDEVEETQTLHHYELSELKNENEDLKRNLDFFKRKHNKLCRSAKRNEVRKYFENSRQVDLRPLTIIYDLPTVGCN